MSYKVLYQAGEDEIEEKKSRFIAHTLPVNSEDEAVAFLNKIKKEYWDARHNCYAYTIGRNNECTRCSDDGEPSGTAGRPMLDVILGSEQEENLLGNLCRTAKYHDFQYRKSRLCIKGI